ncbi:PTPLA-domain-containing protein [Cristinia sonorae]|uniref:Very-long-chain (3R)-3-hydroxyacyl-CoA dehydratase n=1 Tax=Cristinia sonorae TaxID=1940300 RepID=A0A8K0UYH3_9AGAR|nr:PTPLA-domain-containing protein [Cristinia sonorae]
MARIEEVEETHVVPPVRSAAKKKAEPTPSSKPSPTGTLTKYYLALYNFLSSLAWLYVLFLTLQHLLTPNPHSPTDSLLERLSTTYNAVGHQTALVQSAAAMEVLHAATGLVRSPISTTVVQVWSRYQLVWGVAYVFIEAQTTPFYATMVLSWSITEVIRYTHYTLTLLSVPSSVLLYLRYTTFYLLYPTGAGSEAFVIRATLPASPGLYEPGDWLRAMFFVAWWPGLALMMMHMQAQRSKALGSGKKKAKTE